MMVVVGAVVMITRLDERKEPVPVKEGQIGSGIGRWMPAQQVIVRAPVYLRGSSDDERCGNQPGAMECV